MAERINADMDWTQYTREFEMNLRRIRAQRGYSQERVAYDAGMSRLQYQRLEGGGSSKDRPANPTAKTLIALARYSTCPSTNCCRHHGPICARGNGR